MAADDLYGNRASTGLAAGQQAPSMDFAAQQIVSSGQPGAAPQPGAPAQQPVGYNPYPSGSVAGKKWAAEHPDTGAVQYDAEGYPMPTQQQVDAMATAGSGSPNVGGGAYNPNWAPPAPDSDNPYRAGTTDHAAWVRRNNYAKQNQLAKKEWQKQHESARRQQPAAAPQSAAPATPFKSSGIDLTQQGKGESYIDSILKSYSESGIPQVGNESKRTLDSFRSSQPANMDPYYDQASKLTSAKIDNAMAARGSYGSSNATGQIGAAEVALRADQAKANAGYGLQRYAQESSLAGAADSQGNVANGIQYEWTKGLADMAGKSQQYGENRNQNLWNNNFQLAAAKAGIYGAGTSAAIEGVTGATDAALNAQQGVASDALSNANANANASNGATAGLLNAANAGVSNYTKYNAGKSN